MEDVSKNKNTFNFTKIIFLPFIAVAICVFLAFVIISRFNENDDAPMPEEAITNTTIKAQDTTTMTKNDTTTTEQTNPCLTEKLDANKLNEMFQKRGPEWAGADVIDIVDLGDGRNLWLFGDTFYGEVSGSGKITDYTFKKNSAVIQNGECLQYLPNPNEDWVSSSVADQWHWPQDAIVINNRLHVFMNVVQKTDTGVTGFNFKTTGGILAIFKLNDLTKPVSIIKNIPAIDGSSFGLGAIIEDGYLYNNAHTTEGTFLSRVATNQIDQTSNWQFYDGSRFADDIQAAKPISDKKLRIHKKANNEIVAIHLFLGSSSLDIYNNVNLEGPFNNPKTQSFEDVIPDIEVWTYQPILYPQEVDGSEIIVINFNPKKPDDLFNNILNYGPQIIEVAK